MADVHHNIQMVSFDSCSFLQILEVDMAYNVGTEPCLTRMYSLSGVTSSFFPTNLENYLT